jgi:hypothetical protein
MQATCCCMFTSCRTHVNTFMHAHINAAVTSQLHAQLHISHRYTTPHFMPLANYTCECLQCIQDVFMCMLLVLTVCMMASFMHGACVCATTCMWHACVRDSSMHHACGWHACMQCAACMCVWWAFTWHLGMPEGCIVLVPYLLQNCPTI